MPLAKEWRIGMNKSTVVTASAVTSRKASADAADVLAENCPNDAIKTMMMVIHVLCAQGKLAEWQVGSLEKLPGWSWDGCKPSAEPDLCIIGFNKRRDTWGKEPGLIAWAVDSSKGDKVARIPTEEDVVRAWVEKILLLYVSDREFNPTAIRRAIRFLKGIAKTTGYRSVEVRDYTGIHYSVVSRSNLRPLGNHS